MTTAPTTSDTLGIWLVRGLVASTRTLGIGRVTTDRTGSVRHCRVQWPDGTITIEHHKEIRTV